MELTVRVLKFLPVLVESFRPSRVVLSEHGDRRAGHNSQQRKSHKQLHLDAQKISPGDLKFEETNFHSKICKNYNFVES